MRHLFTLIFLFAASSLCSARDLPANGLRADLTAIEYPFVKIAGKTVRLAPGARIFDVDNRIIPPNPMAGRMHVLYTLDIRGDVQDIWLLNTGEAVDIDKKRPK